MSLRDKRVLIAYLAVQAVLGFAWWLAQYLAPSLRELFWTTDVNAGVIRSFALPDLTLFAGGSAVAAALIWRRSRFARPVVWLVLGATAYAWLFCVGQWFSTGQALLSVALMVGAVIGTTLAAVRTP